MIEYIKGELTELTPALATIETGGVGHSRRCPSALRFREQEGTGDVSLADHGEWGRC